MSTLLGTDVTWAAAFAVPLGWVTVLALAGLLTETAAGRVRDVLARWAWVAVLPAGAAVVVDVAPTTVDWLLFDTLLALDDLGRPLLALAVVLYGLALVFVPRRQGDRAPALTALLLVCFAGNAGVFVAADVVTFYLSFTVMSLTGYLLVIHDRRPASLRTGALFLVMTVLGEAAVLAAVVLVAAAGGTVLADAPAAVAASEHRDLVVGLLLLGFGVKAGTVPVHSALPLAYPTAPSVAGAVLAGVMVKAGLVGWLRFLPLGEPVDAGGWAGLLLALALLGAFGAVPLGLVQTDPRAVLAYSSISQMGFLAVLVAVGLAAPAAAEACVLAAVVYAVHHGLAKGSLFLGLHAWDDERVPRAVVLVVMAVASLAVVGAPLTSGYVAKYAAKEAVGDVTFPLGAGVAVADLLPWVGVGSTLLLARAAVLLVHRERRATLPVGVRHGLWALAVVPAVVWVLVLARDLAPPVSVPGLADPGTLWDQSWPLLLGLVVAVVVLRPAAVRARLDAPDPLVPPGDVVLPVSRLVLRLGDGLRRVHDRGAVLAERASERAAATPSPLPLLGRVQRDLGAWAPSGALLLVTVALVVGWAATKAVS